MLGRLLHLGSGGPSGAPTQGPGKVSKPVSSLESVQEDIHTRNLLFPDAQALYQHRNDQVFPLSSAPTTPAASTANAFDFNGDVDLDVRDVRVIIMQDALGPTNATLLFDSHPAPAAPAQTEQPPSTQETKRPPITTRKGSLGQSTRPLVIQNEGPSQQTPRSGAFDRRGSLHGRGQSHVETDAQRAAREYREELATFSSCIFGNSELMAYKGTSTKVHVVPSDSRTSDGSNNWLGDGRSSIGRSSNRSSKLSQSFSSQTVSPTNNNQSQVTSPNLAPRQSSDKKVLITRLFPVTITAEDSEPNTTPQSRCSDDNNGFPFPPTGEDAPKKKKSQPRQRRTPMYAVVLVVTLPPAPLSRQANAKEQKSSQRESSSYNEQDLFSSSYTGRPSRWGGFASGANGEASESSYSADMEDRIDSLTQHWDIIMRTLTHLQSVLVTEIAVHLREVDVTTPGSQSNSTTNANANPSTTSNTIGRTPSVSEPRGAETARPKPQKSTTKLVLLTANSLDQDLVINGEVEAARNRIVMGLSAARVVTGQGRWGIWRDEARWTARWAGGVGEGLFLHNLLTGFLSIHTDWLQALCPPSYRRRLYLQQKSRNEEDLSLPARTIIISEDKMAARRLIFLLSAFLPANQQLPTTRTHRPSTSTSAGAFSNSPPTYVVPVLREESLRRKINRRTGLRRASHSRTTSQSTRASAIPAQLAHLSMERGHERRVSDAASILPTNFPMSGNDFVSRKSSAATTTTFVPEATMPHFSSVKRVDCHRRPRPDSGSSIATEDLRRSLQRGESTGQLSTASSDSRSQGSKWGSVISGLWNPRRRDSTSLSGYSQTSDLKSPMKSHFSQGDKLSQMVREASVMEEPEVPPMFKERRRKSSDLNGLCTPRQFSDQPRESLQADRTPDPTGDFESPVKTSINADDGVIDVDVAFPDYITSFESAISSPSSSGYLSTPGLPGGLESFEQASRFAIDGDLPLNAAGWLNRYHPDFALQAIAPQDDLVEQVKASLRAEPSPLPLHPIGNDMSERWIDVSCALLADATTNLVTRICYRRLVKPKASADRPSGGHSGPNSYGSALLTPSVTPYDTHLDEDWVITPVFSCDNSFAEAVEKVISLNPDMSKANSSASSQTLSEAREPEHQEPMSITAPEIAVLPQAPLEVPRVQCKAVVLSALEDTIRETIDAREKGEEPANESNKNAIAKGNIRKPRDLLREAVREWLDTLDVQDG